MKGNPFVSYLEQFNILSPNHSKIYDEYTHGDEEFHYELKVDTKIEKHLIDIFQTEPRSIILTGNAGDGKTRLCRVVYDQLSTQNLLKWPPEGIVEVELPNGILRIVKDLSELRDDVIERELTNLQEYIASNHKDKVYYLIAANEGKLTKFLSQNDKLSFLRNEVKDRFSTHEKNNHIFSIYNLLNVTSSVYVEKVLQGWNNEENWKVCAQCSRNNNCVIYLNHERTSEDYIQKRLVEQYRLLDFLDTHITIREMLIHISYILTGGYTCKDVMNATPQQLLEQSKRVYYQNFYGHDCLSDKLSEMRAVKLFQELNPGDSSISAIDDFIINGDICGDSGLENLHEQMFSSDLDMQFGYFKKNLVLYRDHNNESGDSIVNFWINKLRRKLYFEVPTNYFVERTDMLPFKFVDNYQEIFGNKIKQQRIIKNLLNGLNRAFTKKLTERNGKLYVANENLLISDMFTPGRRNEVQLIQDSDREDLDYISSKYFLLINNSIKLPINLAMFEYLLRLSSGDLFHILKEDVDILIDTFKNELIQQSEPNGYSLDIFKLDKESGLYIEATIDLPEEVN
ncbi:hypothetical protein [Ectobacillus panaciterrae]|uniref:hypothetical protein n=1 Tax=Ectobacillus panaciterrae TaxID=363872 RepID=UPI000424AF34|nr:hypothetical protein [Ectobacillus panaciterrae]